MIKTFTYFDIMKLCQEYIFNSMIKTRWMFKAQTLFNVMKLCNFNIIIKYSIFLLASVYEHGSLITHNIQKSLMKNYL